jgi:hypothetical protein
VVEHPRRYAGRDRIRPGRQRGRSTGTWRRQMVGAALGSVGASAGQTEKLDRTRTHRRLGRGRVPAAQPADGNATEIERCGGQDLNLRPTDLEFDPAASPTRKIKPRVVDQRLPSPEHPNVRHCLAVRREATELAVLALAGGLAHTLAYDAAVMGDGPHPRTASRRSRTVPGDNGTQPDAHGAVPPEFMSRSAVAIAASIPGAERQVIDAACSPSFDANPRYCLDIKQFQDFQDRVLRMAQENATVSDHPG